MAAIRFLVGLQLKVGLFYDTKGGAVPFCTFLVFGLVYEGWLRS